MKHKNHLPIFNNKIIFLSKAKNNTCICWRKEKFEFKRHSILYEIVYKWQQENKDVNWIKQTEKETME